MARQYSPRTFLRQTPKMILIEYFQKKGLLREVIDACVPPEAGEAPPSAEQQPPQPPDLPTQAQFDKFNKLTRTKCIDALAQAIENLSETKRAKIEVDFELVNEMAYDRGVEAILEEAAFRKMDWAGKFAKLSNHYERAFRAFLDEPDLFYVAGHFEDMDRVGSWQRRTIGKGLAPKVEKADLDALAAAISELYKRQGRGRFCAVDNYLRQAPERHCYFVYPEDHPVTEPSFDNAGKLQQVPRRPVFEIILVYRSEEGILEISARGDKEHKEAIMTALCQTILGLPGLPADVPGPDFDLSSLKKRDTKFTTEVADGIEAVDVKMLCVEVSGSKRITFEATPSRQSPLAIHDLIDRAVNKQNVSFDSLLVTKAKIRMTFAPRPGGRQKTFTFEIGHPNRCTLRDDKYDQIAKKYLKLWGIARG